jgi:peptide alpha-N-acetyltransferase
MLKDGGREGEALFQLRIEEYRDETQLPDIMTLVDRDLSEPYSIFTYRYFLQGWPSLCYLAWVGDEMVGVVVCKAEVEAISEINCGYIAMLAVDQKHRRRGIGQNKLLVGRNVLKLELILTEFETPTRISLDFYGRLCTCISCNTCNAGCWLRGGA